MPFKAGHLFLLGAIAMAILTAVLFMNMMKGQSVKEPKKAEAVDVIISTGFVPKGTILTSRHMKKTEWPKKFLAPGSYFKTRGKLMGKTVRMDIMPGELFYKEKLTGDKSRGGMPVLIPSGHRAVSVSVNEVRGVAGFVKPGNWVDVVATFQLKSSGDKVHVTRTVLQNVLVLASAQTMVMEGANRMAKPEVLSKSFGENRDKKKGKVKEKSARELEKERKAKEKAEERAQKQARTVGTVTLALTPDQVERLALIEEASSVHLALRAEGDKESLDVKGVTTGDILTGRSSVSDWTAGLDKKAPPEDFSKLEELTPPPMANPSMDEFRTVEVIEGTTRSKMNF